MQYSPLYPTNLHEMVLWQEEAENLSRVCEEVRAASGSLVQEMARCQAGRAAFDFLSHLSHLSGPEKHLPESRRDHKGHEGQMLSLLHLKFTVNNLFLL